MSILAPVKANIEVPNSRAYLLVIEPAINEVSKKGEVSSSSKFESSSSLTLIKFLYFFLLSQTNLYSLH